MDFQLSFLVHPNMRYPSTSDSGIGMTNWNIFCKHNYLEILVNKVIWSLNLPMSGVIKCMFGNGHGVICWHLFLLLFFFFEINKIWGLQHPFLFLHFDTSLQRNYIPNYGFSPTIPKLLWPKSWHFNVPQLWGT